MPLLEEANSLEESRIIIRYFVVTMTNIFYGYNPDITIIFTIDQSKSSKELDS